MFGLKPSEVASIVDVLQSFPDIEEAIVYGSRAMGNYKPGSDVDIALKGNLSPETSSDIAAILNERLPLPYKFDVIAYSILSNKDLIKHIDHHGKTLYKRL